MSFVTSRDLSDANPRKRRIQPHDRRQASSRAIPSMDAFGMAVEYIRPVATVREGFFPNSAALEAGGDVMSDDSMGTEEMVFEGLTGHDADMVPNQAIADSVDAGGQEPFVEVATMEGSDWDEATDGGSDGLVEPGEAPDQEIVQSPEPPVFRPAQNGAQRNGASQNGAQRNGASQNGAQAAAARNGGDRNGSHRPAQQRQNGAQRNGQHQNGVVPRNRIAAYDNAAPLIQGTGAATIARPRGFSTTEPPNPASFGLGQTTATVPAQQTNVGLELTKQALEAGSKIGTAYALSKLPPEYRPPQATGQDPTASGAGQDKKDSSVMPWVLGAVGVGAAILGIWWMSKKKDARQEAELAPVPVQVVGTVPASRSNPRRAKRPTKKGKAKGKSKKGR